MFLKIIKKIIIIEISGDETGVPPTEAEFIHGKDINMGTNRQIIYNFVLDQIKHKLICIQQL